jgi:hypothetical protein
MEISAGRYQSPGGAMSVPEPAETTVTSSQSSTDPANGLGPGHAQVDPLRETTLKAAGHAHGVGAKEGSHSLQTSPDSLRPASGICSGERPSARPLQTCPDPLSVPGGQGR